MTLKVNANGEIVEASRNYGWDGSAWRKLPLVWGYSDRYVEREANTNADAGLNALTFTTIPADEVWFILGGLAYNTTSSNTVVEWLHTGSVEDMRLRRSMATAANDEIRLDTMIVLKPGDTLQVNFNGCTAGDTIVAYAWGYKMKIAE